MPTLLLSLFLVLSSLSLFGQEKFAKHSRRADSILAIKYFNKADSSFANVDTCIHYSRLAIPLLQRTEQWDKYVYVLAGLSYCYRTKENFEQLERNNGLAYREAQAYLSPSDPVYIAVLNNLGKVYSDVRQDYQQAATLYQEALSLFDSIQLDVDYVVKGTILKNLGDVLLQKGDFERAIVYLEASLDEFEVAYRTFVQQNTTAYFKFAEVYQSLARVHQYQGDLEVAKEYLKRLLTLLNSKPTAFHSSYFLYAYTQLAEIALTEKAYPTAADQLRSAQQLPKLSPRQLLEIHRLYGQLYLQQGNWNAAHQQTDRALGYSTIDQPIDRAEILYLRGQILYQEGQYTTAISTYQEALDLLLPDGAPSLEDNSYDFSGRIRSRLAVIDQLQATSQCYQALYEREEDSAYLREVLHGSLLISKLSDQLRQNYQTEESKIFLNRKVHAFYEDGIAAAYALHQDTGEDRYQAQAFLLMEKSKASILLDELRTKEALGVFAIPKELAARGYKLKVDLNYYRKRLTEEARKGHLQDENKLNAWNQQLLVLLAQEEEYQQHLQHNYPDYLALTQRQPVDLSSFQTELSSGTAAISFFLGKQASYALLIRTDRVRLVPLPPRDTLRHLAQQLLAKLKMESATGPQDFNQLAHQLYTVLLGSFELADITKLVLVPDGYLAFLPFEILLPSSPKTTLPRAADYLLSHHRTSYAYSLSVWQMHQQASPLGKKTLVVAPVFQNDPKRYLRYSEAEIESFTSTGSHMVLSHQGATAARFLEAAPQYDLIYLSTHATAGDATGRPPFLDFYDKSLQLSDLYTLNLPTHLIILSACETGLGQQNPGEGVMSLARGFTYAGVPSVMTTLWKVNEKATSSIAHNCFQYLQSGLEKDEALQRAKLDYLRECEDIYAAPYYWASFVVIGNTTPVFAASTKIQKWQWILSGLIFFLLAFSLLRKKLSS